MRLLIRMRDGAPYEHPITEDNFRQVFPEINLDNLPQEFAVFEQTPRPVPEVYEVVEEAVYEIVGNTVKEVWVVRDMSAAEKQQKIAAAMAYRPFPSWVFVEPTCSWVPPINFPIDGKRYKWDEVVVDWVEIESEQLAPAAPPPMV
jgi:hypothetical protein